MSFSELRDDKYNFLNYTLENYELGYGPPLITKKSRLIVAATNNDLETLKELLDSPKWYEVQDEFGFNLLQIAILRESDEIFDYLLSLDDFPLEAVNGDGDTALAVALSYDSDVDPKEVRYKANGLQAFHLSNEPKMQPDGSWKKCDKSINSRYACELLKKGANIDRVGAPLLHCALKWSSLDVVQLLIEKGADIDELDKDRFTPLEVCDRMCDNERIAMLLCYGADPTKWFGYSERTLFDHFLSFEIEIDVFRPPEEWRRELLENLLYLTHDEWNLCRIDGNSLLKLAYNRSPAFSLLMNFTPKIIITHSSNISSYCLLLLTIELEDLQILIEKYPSFVQAVLQNFTKDSMQLLPQMILKMSCPFCLKNLDMLLHSPFYSDTMELIFNLNSSSLLSGTAFLLERLWAGSKDERIKMIFYLLSYGMLLYEKDLEDIYKIAGYSEDFKNLLFMDLQKPIIAMPITKIIPRLLYDVTLDLHSCVKDSYFCWRSLDWNQLFDYFAHQTFQEIYNRYSHWSKRDNVAVRHLPKIPLLQELARDSFRKYFIEVFEIKTAKKFYSLIKLLPVNNVYKKIITFELKLY